MWRLRDQLGAALLCLLVLSIDCSHHAGAAQESQDSELGCEDSVFQLLAPCLQVGDLKAQACESLWAAGTSCVCSFVTPDTVPAGFCWWSLTLQDHIENFFGWIMWISTVATVDELCTTNQVGPKQICIVKCYSEIWSRLIWSWNQLLVYHEFLEKFL